jgi:Uma2 family endonuclease
MSTPLAEPVDPAIVVMPTDDEPLYEIIDGERKELPPMSAYAVRIANELCGELHLFAAGHSIGRPYTEMLFRLPLNGSRTRRLDVAFVSYQRWPKDRPMTLTDNAWDVVPDVAVEVISPTDLVYEIMQKFDEYFRANVRLVWVVHPPQRRVYVYESPTQVRVLGPAEELDGGAVLPGFRLPLANLFPEVAPSS